MDKELRQLYEQDQADRLDIQNLTLAQSERLIQKDRERVEELIAQEALQTPEDYFHAAMLFQHGETLEHYWHAHELAKKGAELGHPTCRWLAAAAYDRWLMRQGKLQKYGTQYILKDEQWALYEFDPAMTDAQRAEWNVPPLAQLLQRVEKMNQK